MVEMCLKIAEVFWSLKLFIDCPAFVSLAIKNDATTNMLHFGNDVFWLMYQVPTHSLFRI